nr:MAG TPA: hypothetical protein [Caudoviricetes sp.]
MLTVMLMVVPPALHLLPIIVIFRNYFISKG